MTTYNELAVKALLDSNPSRRQARLAELTAHSEGRFTCPDCGHEGPHDVQDEDFACAGCGMQHPVPEV